MTRYTNRLPPDHPDRELVGRLLGGDERAFTELVRAWYGPLMRMARNFVASEAVAEEAVQETWLEVFKGLERFEGRSSLRTWVFRILMNRARTRGEREHRSVPFSALAGTGEDRGEEPAVDPSRFGPDGHWLAFPEEWPRLSPEGLLESRELAGHVASAIDALPANLRAVVELRDRDQWSSEEVCDLLGISDANQRVLLHRARSRVRQALESRLGKGKTP